MENVLDRFACEQYGGFRQKQTSGQRCHAAVGWLGTDAVQECSGKEVLLQQQDW